MRGSTSLTLPLEEWLRDDGHVSDVEDQIPARLLMRKLYREVVKDGAHQRAKQLLQRFEVTKRIYDVYDDSMRPVNKSTYHTVKNHIDAASLFAKGYELSKDLVYLNALLKVMDTLSSLALRMEGREVADFSRLIEIEKGMIGNLVAELNIQWLC